VHRTGRNFLFHDPEVLIAEREAGALRALDDRECPELVDREPRGKVAVLGWLTAVYYGLYAVRSGGMSVDDEGCEV
jgi:hypothetical protein